MVKMERFVRRRLARFRCGLFDQVKTSRALLVLPAIAQFMPQRVVAACIRTQWKGWVTARRFQIKGGRCCFDC